jgi:hypothetical protein
MTHAEIKCSDRAFQSLRYAARLAGKRAVERPESLGLRRPEFGRESISKGAGLRGITPALSAPALAGKVGSCSPEAVKEELPVSAEDFGSRKRGLEQQANAPELARVAHPQSPPGPIARSGWTSRALESLRARGEISTDVDLS